MPQVRDFFFLKPSLSPASLCYAAHDCGWALQNYNITPDQIFAMLQDYVTIYLKVSLIFLNLF